MARRIFAWVLLIGFVLLLANIIFIGFQRTLSLIVYIFIALYFVFVINRKKKADNQ